MTIATSVYFFAVGMLTSILFVDQVSANPPQSTGRVMIKRKTHKALKSKGKSQDEINNIRTKAMEMIEKNQVTGRIPQLDIHIVQVGHGAEKAFIAQHMNSDLFEYMEEDVFIAFDEANTPTDPEFVNQWHHTKIQSELAWNISTGSPDITVAVCDKGVLIGHEDLENNRVEGYNTVSRLWESKGGNVTALDGHGTQVAGCVAAVGVSVNESFSLRCTKILWC